MKHLHLNFLIILVINCRKWVLSKFSDNKLLLNQLFILIKTLLIFFFLISEGLEFVIIMLVLSANKIGLDISDIIFWRSLIYSRKNNGPSIELCGTPHLTGSHLKNTSWNYFLTNLSDTCYLSKTELVYYLHLKYHKIPFLTKIYHNKCSQMPSVHHKKIPSTCNLLFKEKVYHLLICRKLFL